MRSLFAKTLLWFLATTAIAIGGIILTTALTFRSPDFRQSPFNMLLRLQVEDLKRAYESGGQPALAAVMARFQSITQSRFVFTDSQGTDLLTNQPRPDLQKRMGARPRPPVIPFIGRPAGIIARPDATRRYWLFVIEERRGSFFWFLQYQHLWIVALVVMLCYAFAYHLTSPVQRLKKTVEGFGAGDLSARASTKRHDEIGQLAGAFNQMADRIQTLVSAERRLLQDISHELRSPLARLGVAIELARSARDEDTLDRIQREADRLNELVGELIEVTRAEGDPSKQRIELVRLDELLTDLLDAISIEATARDCKLQLESTEPVTVAGDEELLRRVVENVVRNAVRYAPPGTSIDVRLQRIGDRARILVRDYGPGVPKESLPRIFDAFYRVDSDRDRASGGVGLGLAIARRAVELHKGSLEAQNANPGLLVTIDLPVAAPLSSTAVEKPVTVFR